jgi:hypothetical protein
MDTDSDLKLRGLSFGEFYYILQTQYRQYAYTHLFIVFKRSGDKVSLHVPRTIFNKPGYKLGIVPIVIQDSIHFEKTQNPMDYIRHYNILIIDYVSKSVERFEPADSKSYGDLDKLLRNCFNENRYKYHYANYVGPQYNEICEVGMTMNCGYWSLLYIQDRIYNILKNDKCNFQKSFIKTWMIDISKRGYYNTLCDYKTKLLVCFEANRDIVIKYNDLVFSNIFWRRPLDYYDYFIKIKKIV